jgi:hypothetical protein
VGFVDLVMDVVVGTGIRDARMLGGLKALADLQSDVDFDGARVGFLIVNPIFRQ